MKFLSTAFLFLSVFFSVAQAPEYDDLVFDEDEIKGSFKAGNKPYVNLKSKKGSGGMSKTSSGDSIKGFEITDIVLVFTETTEDAADTREENNRERWENLIKTYPEFFQFNTNYKNICQCSIGGNAEALKNTQGFYVYFKAPAPKPAAVSAPPKEEAKPVTKTETKKEEAVKEEPKKEIVKEEVKKADEPSKKQVAEKKEEKKEETKVAAKEEKKPAKVVEEEKEEDLNAVTDGPAETSAIEISSKHQKRTGYSKPKKAKNPKACRPPFYGSGDEDLHVFFKENITLSKKQRRQVKGDASILKLSLNFDGTIKKALVNGANKDLNELVTLAVKSMDVWNPAVKNGLTVKSEVKITLKYDKATKAIKPMEVMITPRPNPKCTKCLSDAELFDE
jgi:hypothetical protein